MNKLERLLKLIAVLLETEIPLTASQIQERVEGYPDDKTAFKRAFERDKDDIRELGIPLEVRSAPGESRPVDGYFIDPARYYLPDPGLEPEELAAIHLASLTVRFDGLTNNEALWKLGGVSEMGHDPAHQGLALLPSDPALVPLFDAISNHSQVEFVYRNQGRTVDPWRLDFQRGRWYLTGFDHLRQAERNYRLDRIEGEIQVTSNPLLRPPKPSDSARPTPAWEMGDDEPVVARLKVDADHVASAARQLGPDINSQPRPDGGVVFEVPVVNYLAFRSFVLGFLDHVELLGPADWRRDIIDWLSALEQGEPNGA